MLYQTIDPYTEEVVETFPSHTDAELESIIAKAEKTYATDWSVRPLASRKAVLKKAASILRRKSTNSPNLSRSRWVSCSARQRVRPHLAQTSSNTMRTTRKFLAPERLPVKDGEAVIENAPLGVLFCIEPWNYPYYQLARVAGPNLMLGNTVISKHAPNVPQCAQAFAKLFLDAGAQSVWTNVFITNEQSAKVITDTQIKGVALTGSERAGSAVASRRVRHLKKSAGCWNSAAAVGFHCLGRCRSRCRRQVGRGWAHAKHRPSLRCS